MRHATTLATATLALLTLLGPGGAPSVFAQADTSAGLRDLADFPIGGAINLRKVLADPKLEAIVEGEFSSLTATNDMKMYVIADTTGPLDFAKADALADYAEAHGMRLFGHTLVWHYGLPEHVASLDSAAMSDYLHAYIDTVAGRYRGRVDGWDVVNEAFATSGPGYRTDSPWFEKLGPGYIADAFRWARAAAPEARLFINDFATEVDTAKLGSLLRHVAAMRSQGVPIDGIGLQFHINVDTDTAAMGAALRRVAATGLLVHISELDVIFNRHNDTPGSGFQKVEAITPELLAKQARQFEAVAHLYRANVPPAQRYGITFWDFTDRDSWINDFFGVTDWPTVYDEELERKPAYGGFARGLGE